jgi:hypothetical protein
MQANINTARLRLGASLAAALALSWAAPSHALEIIPTFDPTITNRANAAQIEAAINQVVQTYGQLYSNNVTVRIDFQLQDLGGPGGRTLPLQYVLPYADYEFGGLAQDAATHPWNSVLATAQANLAYGNTPASVGVDFVQVSAVDLRALGDPFAVGLLGSDGVVGDGTFDAIVQLDDGPADEYSFTSNVGPGQFSGLDALYHEVDEVLGIGGGGSTLNIFADGFNPDAIGPLDPYRYSAPHTPSFTTDPDVISYFSIDGGVTRIGFFNQVSPGDLGDSGRFACDDGLQAIQEWTGCPGEPYLPFTALGPESIALQSIGYNLVPEPETWALMMLGVAMVGHAARRRSQGIPFAFATV